VGSPSKIRLAVATLVFVVVVLTMSVTANAEPPHLEIPPDTTDCPSADDLRRLISAQLGRGDTFDRSDSPSVNVRVRKASDGTLSADLSVTRSMTTTRTIDSGESCADLVRAAALSVALAIEQEEEERRQKEPPPPPPPPPKETEPLAPQEIRRDRVAITGSALTTVGLLPRPAAGVGVGARVRVSEAAWLSARGFVLPGASMPNETFGLNLITGGPGVCVEPFGSNSVALAACGHVVAGAWNTTKTSVDFPSKTDEVYVAATLSAGARARIVGPLHLDGAVDAHLPFTRPTFLTTTCPPTGFEPAFVALAVWLGAGISIR